jgi:3-oxoacyl-[acyl-carrier protein] reductase
MIGTAISTFGRLDILVNNAGILTPTKTLPDMEIDEYDRLVRVHLRGAFCTSIQATRYWRDEFRREGAQVDRCIVNTSSISFLYGSPWRPNYGAAKGGIAALTMGTAAACAWFGVRANAICPNAYGRMSYYRPPLPGALPTDDAMAEARSPDTNAPFVVAIAGPAGAGITGQLFWVTAEKISVLGAPQVVAEFEAKGRWTPEQVGEHLSDYFATTRPGYGWPVRDEVKEMFPTMSV